MYKRKALDPVIGRDQHGVIIRIPFELAERMVSTKSRRGLRKRCVGPLVSHVQGKHNVTIRRSMNRIPVYQS